MLWYGNFVSIRRLPHLPQGLQRKNKTTRDDDDIILQGETSDFGHAALEKSDNYIRLSIVSKIRIVFDYNLEAYHLKCMPL